MVRAAMTDAKLPDATSTERVFLPSPTQIAVLIGIAVATLAAAFALRFLLVEPPAMAAACDAAGRTFACGARRIITVFFTYSVFGWVGLGAALLNLVRPSVVLIAIALVGCGLGLVLYNTLACSFAIPLLVLSLARRAPEPD